MRSVSNLDLLCHCLGMQTTINFSPLAQQIAEHTIIVTLDAEHWSNNSLEMTELGICTIARQDLLPLVQANNFGDHGENIMKAAKYYFFRLR